jgi:hypothetical protein
LTSVVFDRGVADAVFARDADRADAQGPIVPSRAQRRRHLPSGLAQQRCRVVKNHALAVDHQRRPTRGGTEHDEGG